MAREQIPAGTGSGDQVYLGKDNPRIVRVDAEGKKYMLTIAEGFEEVPFAEA